MLTYRLISHRLSGVFARTDFLKGANPFSIVPLFLLLVGLAQTSCVGTTDDVQFSHFVLLSHVNNDRYEYLIVVGRDMLKDPEHPQVVWRGENIGEACAVVRKSGEQEITWLDFKYGFPLPNLDELQKTTKECRSYGIRVNVRYLGYAKSS